MISNVDSHAPLWCNYVQGCHLNTNHKIIKIRYKIKIQLSKKMTSTLLSQNDIIMGSKYL